MLPFAVTDVMSPSVETAPIETSVRTAARTLRDRDIGSVVVVDDGAIVGIVAESDLVDVLAEGRDPETLTLADVMSEPVATISSDADVATAARRLRDRGYKKLPVVEDGDLVGVVTTTDISNYLPHVRRAAITDSGVDDGRVRRTDRPDTAYERDDWTFEYVGHESAIDVGDVVRFSKPLSEADVEGFAEASGDTNRLHLDADYAAGTRFGRRIAHGTLVAGVVSAALARLPGLVVYLSQEVGYLGPVDVGDRVTAECEVVEDIGDERYRLSTVATDGDGETVVDGEAVVLADPIPETA